MKQTNPHKGDVPFQAGDRTFVLCYSHMALVKLEDLMGKSIVQIMSDLGDLQHSPQNLRIRTAVSLLWAGLQKHHSQMTFEDAADLLDDMEGGAGAVMDLVSSSLQKAFAAPGTKGTNPPLANGQNGTGTDFLSSTSATAIHQGISGTSPPER